MNRLILPATILISSLILGSFFYLTQVQKQQSIERQQKMELEQKKQEKLDKELEEKKAKEEAEEKLNDCLADAEQNNRDWWRKECKDLGKLSARCILLNETTFDEYVKQNKIPDDKKLDAMTDFYKELTGCSCLLPFENAERIDKSLQNDKDECFKRYPQKN